jgi:hypothetical protein
MATQPSAAASSALTAEPSAGYDAGGIVESSNPFSEQGLMPSVLRPDLEDCKKFLVNRAQFPPTELARYSGQWVAWSPDGSRIVAHAEFPDVLEELVIQAGEDPERCVLEGIPEEDALLGGAGLGPTRP